MNARRAGEPRVFQNVQQNFLELVDARHRRDTRVVAGFDPLDVVTLPAFATHSLERHHLAHDRGDVHLARRGRARRARRRTG